jgi:hypothetical protein
MTKGLAMPPQSQSPDVRRPGVVTFIAAILFVQAALAVTSTVTLLIWRGPIVDFLEKEESPLSNASLNGTIIGEAITAVLLVMVAGGLMRGSKGTRFFVAIVEGITMALAMYVLVIHQVGGYMYRAVFSLFVGVFVLWALFANDESAEYFESEWP